MSIYTKGKFNCLKFASAENIVTLSGSLAEYTSLLITAAAATLYLSFEPSV